MAASMKDERSSGCEWLYPDLLSRSDLLCVLKQRYVKEDDLDLQDKEYLIELYNKYVIPKPQRKYRLNRRGREMTKKQIVMAKKRKLASEDNDEPLEKKSAMDTRNSRFISSFKDTSTEDRLKPPPSCINFERKKIKLSASSSSEAAAAATSSKDSEDTKTKEITNNIKTIKLKTSASPNSREETTKNSSLTMKTTINLINKHIGSPEVKTESQKTTKIKSDNKTAENSSSKSDNIIDRNETKMETETTEESPKKKIKIKRISWP